MSGKVEEFVAEAEELMSEALSSLLEARDALPASPPPDLINAVFRAMHTMKGMSGLFGFQGLSDISHSLENILDMVRLGKADFNADIAEFLFSCLDSLKLVLDSIRAGKGEDTATATLVLEHVDAFHADLSSSGAAMEELFFPAEHEGLLDVLSEYEEHRLRTNINDGNGIFLIKTVFPIDTFDVDLKQLTERVKGLCEVISTMPTSDGVPDGNIGFQVIVASLATDSSELAGIAGHEMQELVPAKGEFLKPQPAQARAAADTAKAEQSLKSASTTIRVDINRVDGMLDTIAALSLSKQAVFDIWRSFSEEYGNTPLSVDLYRVSQAMKRRLDVLQSQMLELRMVPIGQVFSRLTQVVSRYSSSAGKRIKLEFFGGDSEIDKFVAEEIIDPLMHTVRNAIDHGIETAEERGQCGKPEEGRLQLRAFQKGNNIVIIVRDDGRGIDPEKVRAKAIEKGMAVAGEGAENVNVYDLMFLPGFSTAESVSETSGRGVGLDVVKEKMDSLGGTVEVESEPGAGTGFIFTLPITLSLIRALIVRLGPETYAVPLISMAETFAADRSEFQEVESGTVYNLRGEMLPLVDLRDVLGFEPGESERYFVVVVGQGHRKMGLLLDEFLGEQEIIIKPLGDYFDGVKGYAGASEIGRYKVILVLDTEALVNEAISRKSVLR